MHFVLFIVILYWGLNCVLSLQGSYFVTERSTKHLPHSWSQIRKGLHHMVTDYIWTTALHNCIRDRCSSFGMHNIDHKMNHFMLCNCNWLCVSFFTMLPSHLIYNRSSFFHFYFYRWYLYVCCIHTITVYMKSYLSCKSCRVCCLKVHFTLKKISVQSVVAISNAFCPHCCIMRRLKLCFFSER